MPLYSPARAATLGADGVAVSHTGNTDETALATITVPAMGPRDRIRVFALFSYPTSGNSKTFRVRLGGLAGTNLAAAVVTSTTTLPFSANISNRGATNSQVGTVSNSASFSASSNAVLTASVETNAGTTLVISGQLASAGETLVLEQYIVEMIRG